MGHKQREGDQRTPEGRYTLDYKKSNSGFYKAIHINYPNLDDIKRANELGVNPGGMITIHGQRSSLGIAGAAVQLDQWLHRGAQPRDGRDLGTPSSPVPHHHRALIPPSDARSHAGVSFPPQTMA